MLQYVRSSKQPSPLATTISSAPMGQQLRQERRGCKQAELGKQQTELLKAWARGWYGQPSPKQTGNGHGCQCFTPLYDSDDEPTEPNIGVINALAVSTPPMHRRTGNLATLHKNKQHSNTAHQSTEALLAAGAAAALLQGGGAAQESGQAPGHEHHAALTAVASSSSAVQPSLPFYPAAPPPLHSARAGSSRGSSAAGRRRGSNKNANRHLIGQHAADGVLIDHMAPAGSMIRHGAAVKVEVADAMLNRQQHHRQHKQAPVVPLSAAVLHTTAGQQVPLEKLSVVSNVGSKADNLLRPYHHLRMMEEHHQHHQQRRPTQACLPKVVGCSHMVTTRAVGWPAGSTAVSAG